MRVVVYGAGAIGGAVGARLHQSGCDVTLIARGEHGRAIRERGLRLETSEGTEVVEVPAVDGPDAVQWAGDEVVLLCMKSQDTADALSALRAAAPPSVAVVCVQNGVENERRALRVFEHVYGAVVMLPASHLEPGSVEAYGAPLTGIIDVGRYPEGLDDRSRELAAALAGARVGSEPHAEIMSLKYAKLLMNLGNAAGALCRPGPERDELVERAREEGQAALAAAGIGFDETWPGDREQQIGGRRSGGGNSTWQSLARGAGAVETDYLNGEIVLLGRLHEVPTPVNAALCVLGARAVREGWPPESLSAEEVVPAWTS
jgi:2-dehydropantoate 2-reductase